MTLLELQSAPTETRLVSARFHGYSLASVLFRSHNLHDFLGGPDDRLLASQRAVVVENGNAIGRRYERRAAGLRHPAHEVDDSASGGTVVLRIELR